MANNNIRNYLAQVKPKSLESNSNGLNDLSDMSFTGQRTEHIRQSIKKDFNMQEFIEKQSSQSNAIPSGSFGEKFGPSTLEKELFNPKLNEIVEQSQNNTDALSKHTQFRKKNMNVNDYPPFIPTIDDNVKKIRSLNTF